MAYLTGPLYFTGSVNGLRSYYNRSLKRYILSTKGGSPREIILNSPAYVRTRENMSEFKGCAKWASLLRGALYTLAHLRQGYYFSAMMAMAKMIQKNDIVNNRGRRSICSSQAADMLPELRFNTEHPFERVIYLNFELQRSADLQTLTMTIPPFHPRVSLKWPTPIQSFRLTLLTTLLPDVGWNEELSGYWPTLETAERFTRTAQTEWRAVCSPPEEVVLTLPVPPVPEQSLLVVALGVEIRTSPSATEQPTGTMKILRCYEPTP